MNASITALAIAGLVLLMPMTVRANDGLELTSRAFSDGGALPLQFTCDGGGMSPPLSWSGVPDGTRSLVIIMDHQPRPGPEPQLPRAPESSSRPNPDTGSRADGGTQPPPSKGPEGIRWYWSMYNIPPTVAGTEAGQSVGTLGNNIVNQKNEYAPPCSKGPGIKVYTFHLYALSKSLDLTPADKVSATMLRKHMHDWVLASDSLSVSFERTAIPAHDKKP
ncbi:YbhB/YbcL family Raf kinase inhibitor-like protein [Oceanobacter sp. 5_MG-2023]|uniref:YbhB/YbcL family Raf kinase inhibitor-like protein n=1 Tax=Oceanobacter sp. 5_MG-2023 TaxID=3062645 RepID=UPI0026E3726E|nr:YbhB/YbcL family Raf kinase inhibitor-like protein [Oceanobacter sp. 5_MG-2023]MDO6682550.1 YbhB/YbcL family Raf kinase inhibitor-like protein [Oceanobacter sp. 5_MG-2023]